MNLGKADREAVRLMYGGLCTYCGEPLGARWHIDHIEPVVRVLRRVPGRDVIATGKFDWPERHCIENMTPACPPCNIDKHSLTLEQWRTKLAGAVGVLSRNQPTYRHARRFGLVVETGRPIVFHFERVAATSAEGANARSASAGAEA